ncbi:unnamed protein product [Lactuca saligna]|uniref:Uncharacterized protein n=1 Tax=Lactuca saligna TaxID=75948 RepID=A0AA36ENB9_LACSI|nr:unnamed protein product [Lactuca saligna]
MRRGGEHLARLSKASGNISFGKGFRCGAMVSSASSSAHSCFICFESIQPTHNRFFLISLQIPIKERYVRFAAVIRFNWEMDLTYVFFLKAMNCAHKVLDKMSVRAFSTGMMEGISMGQLLRSVYEPQDLIVKTSTQNHKVSAILVFRDFTSSDPFHGQFPTLWERFCKPKSGSEVYQWKETQS